MPVPPASTSVGSPPSRGTLTRAFVVAIATASGVLGRLLQDRLVGAGDLGADATGRGHDACRAVEHDRRAADRRDRRLRGRVELADGCGRGVEGFALVVHGHSDDLAALRRESEHRAVLGDPRHRLRRRVLRRARSPLPRKTRRPGRGRPRARRSSDRGSRPCGCPARPSPRRGCLRSRREIRVAGSTAVRVEAFSSTTRMLLVS